MNVAIFNGNKIVKIDPATGGQTLVSPPPNSTNNLSNPIGLTFGPDGNLYIGNKDGGNILRVNPNTGSQTIIFSDNPNVFAPADLRFGSDGKLYVANHSGNVLRLNNPTATDTSTITQTQVTSGGLGQPHSGPLGLSFGSDGLYYSLHMFANQIVRVNNPTATDISTITQTVISSGGLFNSLHGIEFRSATTTPNQVLYFPLIIR